MSLLARPRAARFAIPILLATLWAVAPGSGESGREWTTSSFLDFVDGALTDGGANTYVGADGTVRLINLWDLNNDGQLDLFFPSSHDHNEKVDLFIYWGDSGFDPDFRTRLPSNGGKAVAIADLNQDRQPDLILVNRFNGTRSDLDSFIYWGSQGGFEPGRRTLLPTRGAEAVAVADLNGDGWKEVVFANSGLSYHVPVDRFNRSFIYWGAASGYSPDRRTSLKTVLARDVEIADLDRDGALDLVFASEGNEVEESGAWIYWGDGSGDFSGRPPTRLPGQRSAAVAATDLNGDGWPDVVLANRFRLRAREMGIYNIIDTVAVDSYVYWGSREGYAAGKRTELPTVAARDVEAADLNGDGRPDLVFANGAGGASYIYWASAGGFHPHKRSALPTSEAAAVEVEDINRDGSPDLVFAQRGDRRTEDGGSLIFWGSGRGFSRERKQTLPTWAATGIAIGDLDSDGRTDLVLANKSDGSRQVPSLLYWGAPNGRYSREARLELGSGGADAYAAADINRDGFPDLFLPEKTPAIYWGGREPYSPSRTSRVDSELAMSGRFADLNRDGYLDLALSEWQPGVEQTSLLWGGPGDYSRDNRFVFEVGGLRHHHLADLDRNGWPDIIFTSTTNRELFIYWNGAAGLRQRPQDPTAHRRRRHRRSGRPQWRRLAGNHRAQPVRSQPQSRQASVLRRIPSGQHLHLLGRPPGLFPGLPPDSAFHRERRRGRGRSGPRRPFGPGAHQLSRRSHPQPSLHHLLEQRPGVPAGAVHTAADPLGLGRPGGRLRPQRPPGHSLFLPFQGWEPPQPGLSLLGRRRRILNRPAQRAAGAGAPFPQRHRHRPHL